jgi:flagellar biosynthesis protein FliR
MSSVLPGIPTLQDFTVTQIELWLFCLIRVSFCVFLLPVLMSDEVPLSVRAGLSFFISLVLFPTLPAQSIGLPDNLGDLFSMAMRELYVGLVMGFAGTFAFVGLRLAGAWMDQEIGFSMVQLFNPLVGEEETAMGSFLQLLFGMLLIASGNYILWLQAIGESFRAIPLASAQFNSEAVLEGFVKLTTSAFEFGIKASAPILVTLFLTSVALAIVARIMPQMNAWLIGMPLKIGLGLLVLWSTMPMIWSLFQKHHMQVVDYALMMQRVLIPKP